MSYRIEGLPKSDFAALFSMNDAQLAAHGAVRVTANVKPGFPCRVTLTDADPGETLILLNHVSHDVATPYRSAYAIFVREAADTAATMTGQVPPVFEGRPLGLRGFDTNGMLRGALLALPGQADIKIRELFASADIAYIHAHNAAHGCFVARVDRGD